MSCWYLSQAVWEYWVLTWTRLEADSGHEPFPDRRQIAQFHLSEGRPPLAHQLYQVTGDPGRITGRDTLMPRCGWCALMPFLCGSHIASYLCLQKSQKSVSAAENWSKDGDKYLLAFLDVVVDQIHCFVVCFCSWNNRRPKVYCKSLHTPFRFVFFLSTQSREVGGNDASSSISFKICRLSCWLFYLTHLKTYVSRVTRQKKPKLLSMPESWQGNPQESRLSVPVRNNPLRVCIWNENEKKGSLGGSTSFRQHSDGILYCALAWCRATAYSASNYNQ